MFELLAGPKDPAANGRAGPLDPPDRMAQAVMDVETAIARATLDRVAFRDPTAARQPDDRCALAQLAPNIDFPLFFRGTGAPAFSRLNLLNPQDLRDLNAALDTLPLASWKAYMKWRALDALAPLLSSALRPGGSSISTATILSGQKEMRPRWMRCSDAVAGQPGADALGEIVGKIFIEQRFGAGREGAHGRADRRAPALAARRRSATSTG